MPARIAKAPATAPAASAHRGAASPGRPRPSGGRPIVDDAWTRSPPPRRPPTCPPGISTGRTPETGISCRRAAPPTNAGRSAPPVGTKPSDYGMPQPGIRERRNTPPGEPDDGGTTRSPGRRVFVLLIVGIGRPRHSPVSGSRRSQGCCNRLSVHRSSHDVAEKPRCPLFLRCGMRIHRPHRPDGITQIDERGDTAAPTADRQEVARLCGKLRRPSTIENARRELRNRDQSVSRTATVEAKDCRSLLHTPRPHRSKPASTAAVRQSARPPALPGIRAPIGGTRVPSGRPARA